MICLFHLFFLCLITFTQCNLSLLFVSNFHECGTVRHHIFETQKIFIEACGLATHDAIEV